MEVIDMTTKAKAATKADKVIMDAMGLQAVPVPCRLHPKYKAIQTPRPTTKNPKGCEPCWEFYRAKQLVNETLPELYVRRHGNPRKFEKPSDLAKLGMDYFRWCYENQQVPTKTGFAVFTGAASDTVRKYRVGDYDSKEDKPTHSAVIKRIDDVIVAGVEQRVLTSTGSQTGAIAWLNNCAGWSQNVRQQSEIGLTIKLEDYSKGKPWSKTPDAIDSTATEIPGTDADR